MISRGSYLNRRADQEAVSQVPYGTRVKHFTPSMYGDQVSVPGGGVRMEGDATGYRSTPMEVDPQFRSGIRQRVYSEQMAPSQQGPYGSLGGSGGRAGRMAQLVQQQNSMGSGRNEEFAALKRK
jgi:hypothetical protein